MVKHRWKLERGKIERVAVGGRPPLGIEGGPAARPEQRRKILVLAFGNSAIQASTNWQALSWQDGFDLAMVGLNNDVHGPRCPVVRLPSGERVTVTPGLLKVINVPDRRDAIRQHPLLERRYARLLANIPVWETYNMGGRGGHSIPQLSAMDIDLEIAAVTEHLRMGIHMLTGGYILPPEAGDLAQAMLEQAMAQQAEEERYLIVVLVGGSGSMGNASAQLLAYPLRYLLAEAGITNYELWGVILGPNAFRGLTQDTEHNYLALLHSLETLARTGLTRQYINGLEVAMRTPPYDQVLLLDEPNMPLKGGRVTEAGLEAFLERAALSLHVTFGTGAYAAAAARLANPLDGVASLRDRKHRWLHTASGQMATVDV
ncbi:MAG: hypothetical protein ACRDIB_17855, partial [Ardenticatenaceae bacterium]